jgi:sugar lactone lactonase YvrE
MRLLEIISAQNIVGEGIVWDPDVQCIWWTDIQGRRLFRYSWPGSATRQVYELPERLGSFGLRSAGAGLIAAFESGIAFFEPDRSRIEWLMRLPAMATKVRFNDGRVDRQGRFWCGTMVEGDRTKPIGQLFCVDVRGQVTCHLEGILISNGICWSPDSRRFYFADSPRREISVFDFDPAAGTISNRRVFARTPEGTSPDGADFDAEGGLWSATWGGRRVVRYTTDGTIDRVVEVPVSQPSCVAFGGPQLTHLFVTSAREGLSKAAADREPHAGDVFVFEMSVRGLASPRFAQ